MGFDLDIHFNEVVMGLDRLKVKSLRRLFLQHLRNMELIELLHDDQPLRTHASQKAARASNTQSRVGGEFETAVASCPNDVFNILTVEGQL